MAVMKIFESIEIDNKVYYRPQAKQKVFHNSILNRNDNGYRDFLYGGAAKGGKSHALRWEAHRNGLEYSGIRMLLVRSSFPELERTHLREIQQDLPPEVGSYNQQKHVFTYFNKSLLEFGYGSTYSDFQQYLSANYDAIFLDEMTTIPFELTYMFRLRLQSSRKDFVPFFAGATNPGSKAHVEVRNYFVTKSASVEEYPGYNKNSICFIPATVYDNEILLSRDPEILTRLQQLPKKEQQKFLYGNWDIFEGQFFDNWNPDVHIIEPKNYLTYSQIKEMQILGGLDYGNITVCIFGAKDVNGNIIIFDELYHDRAIRETKVADMKKFIKDRGLEDITIIADTNMWSPDAFDLAKQEYPAQQYLNANIRLIKVSKNASNISKNKGYRAACNESIYNALDFELDKDTGAIKKQPKIKIYKRCRMLIETFPALIRDNKNDEDIESDQNDHAYDAMKYMYMALIKPRKKKIDDEPNWLKEMKLNANKNFKKDFMGV